MKNQNLIYVNKEISSTDKDYIGYSTQVSAIVEAVENGASMIGLVADYGSGKSSLGQMLSNAPKINKTIKVNMWDGIKENSKSMDERETQNIEALDKTLLYQIAFNSGNKRLAKHVNNRLNKHYGFLTFSLKTYKFWFWFALAVIAVSFGILCSAFDFTIWNWPINNDIAIAGYVATAIFLLVGLSKSSIAFSSWKSEGNRQFDSSDIFSIFSEIVEEIKIKKGHVVVLIEDLDRICNYDTITVFIKEIYRLSNLSKDANISFVVEIKPETKLEKQKTQNQKADFEKIFDFIVELRPIHIDDFRAVLKDLIIEKQDEIRELIECGEPNELLSEFTLLIGGANLTIRTVKHRLNNALLLYQSLKNRQTEDVKYSLSMKTCCAVAYLESQYPEDFYYLIDHNTVFNKIMKQSYSITLQQSSFESQVAQIKTVILDIKKPANNHSIFSENFGEEFTRFIVAKIIKDDFRQYFYSYPKGSYIKTIEENELEEILLYPNSKNISDEELEQLALHSINRQGKVIKDSVLLLKESLVGIPNKIINSESLLSYCFKNFREEVIEMMVTNYLWTDSEKDKTIRALTKINNYTFEIKNQLMQSYAEGIASSVGGLGEKALSCRIGLIKALGGNIKYLKATFIADGCPCLTEVELNYINIEDVLFDLLNQKVYNSTLVINLCNKFNFKLRDENYQILSTLIKNFIQSTTPNENVAIALINFSLINNKFENQITKFALQSKLTGDQISDYLNAAIVTLTAENCKIIEKDILIGVFNDNVLNALYDNGCYFIYLANRIYNNKLDETDFNDKIFSVQLIDKLHQVNLDLFYKYRLALLSQTESIKEVYRYLYTIKYEYLSNEELETITLDDYMKLLDLHHYVNNYDRCVSALKIIIKSNEDIYNYATYLLGQKEVWTVKVFKNIDFEIFNYAQLTTEQHENILELYKQISPINSASEIIGYMSLTCTLSEQLEQRLIDILNDHQLSTDEWQQYVELLNRINSYTETSLKFIKSVKLEEALCPKITDKLYEKGDFKQYIIGKTLYEKKFVYVDTIDINVYLNIYVTVNSVAEYMMKNNAFKVALYQSKNYSNLSKEQLLLFNDWDQNFELFKGITDILDNETEIKDYVMQINKIASVEDSDKIADFVCQEKFLNLLFDEDFKNKIMIILWEEHYWKKGQITRFINKNKKAS